MLKSDVKVELLREPFIPLRLHLSDGRTFDAPFRDVVRVLEYGVLVFLGMKQGTRQAKGYDRFPFDHIERIEHRSDTGRKRKRAS